MKTIGYMLSPLDQNSERRWKRFLYLQIDECISSRFESINFSSKHNSSEKGERRQREKSIKIITITSCMRTFSLWVVPALALSRFAIALRLLARQLRSNMRPLFGFIWRYMFCLMYRIPIESMLINCPLA